MSLVMPDGSRTIPLQRGQLYGQPAQQQAFLPRPAIQRPGQTQQMASGWDGRSRGPESLAFQQVYRKQRPSPKTPAASNPGQAQPQQSPYSSSTQYGQPFNQGQRDFGVFTPGQNDFALPQLTNTQNSGYSQRGWPQRGVAPPSVSAGRGWASAPGPASLYDYMAPGSPLPGRSRQRQRPDPRAEAAPNQATAPTQTGGAEYRPQGLPAAAQWTQPSGGPDGIESKELPPIRPQYIQPDGTRSHSPPSWPSVPPGGVGNWGNQMQGRPDPFYMDGADPFGNWGGMDQFLGQRAAFVNNINAHRGMTASQGLPPRPYDFNQMWGQAGNMYQQGWQNPLQGLFG